MNEPKRYLDGDRGTLSARLLASAERDAPSDRSLQRALALAAAVGAATATGSAGATTASSAVSVTVWLKWLAVGALAGGVTAQIGSKLLDGGSEAPPAARPSSVASAELAVPMPPSLTTGAAAAPAPPSASSGSTTPPALTVAVPSALPPSAPAAPAASVEAPKDTLRDELTRIDAAQRRQAAGDAAGTLAELDAYQRDFPKGRFQSEAALLRAEALAFQGKCVTVRRLAEEAGDGGVLGRRWAALRQRCP